MDETNKGRLVVLTTVYHQSNSQPTSVNYDYGIKLKTDEQPYHRTTSIGEDPKPLDCGWIKTASWMVIKNELPNLRVNPTEQEQKELDTRVIELWIGSDPPEPSFLIYPGRHFAGCPADLSQIRLRCCKGTTKYSVSLYPD